MLAIVILNYISVEKTIECVESIREAEIDKLKIIVIDNASPNESYTTLCRKYYDDDTISIFKTDENLGFSGGMNAGVKEAKMLGYRYTILSNNDIIFNKDVIKELYNAIVYQTDAVIIGPKICGVNGLTQHSSSLGPVSFKQLLGFVNEKTLEKLRLNEDHITGLHKVYSVSGSCFIIDSDKFVTMGLFDTNTFLYNEENIISSKAEYFNYGVYFQPDVSVVHHHGITTGKDNLFVAQELLKSSVYYWVNYRNGSKKDMFLIIFFHTVKSIIKSIYKKSYRRGWKKYWKATFYSMNIEARTN